MKRQGGVDELDMIKKIYGCISTFFLPHIVVIFIMNELSKKVLFSAMEFVKFKLSKVKFLCEYLFFFFVALL